MQIVSVPQKPLIPYHEPTEQDGALLSQKMCDFMDSAVAKKDNDGIEYKSVKNPKKRRYNETTSAGMTFA